MSCDGVTLKVVAIQVKLIISVLLLKVVVIYEGVQIRLVVTFFAVAHDVLKEVIVCRV